MEIEKETVELLQISINEQIVNSYEYWNFIWRKNLRKYLFFQILLWNGHFFLVQETMIINIKNLKDTSENYPVGIFH